MTPVTLILARADNGVIGDGNRIPWRIPDDLKRFKALTMGKPIVMGRKTWESFPRKPLPGRTNIVISRDPNLVAPGAVVVHSFEEALSRAAAEIPKDVMIVGGAEIYRVALPQATRIELTEVHEAFRGDVSLEPFDPKQWRETAREERSALDGLRYSYVTLVRR